MKSNEYAAALGDNLRHIRQQKGLSLHDVQSVSGDKWKAAVVGAYERGDRNVTVGRLAELADFYEVPISEILPDDGAPAPAHAEARRRIVLDLDRLESVPPERREPITRFAGAIQVQRGDYNGRVLTIREDDLLPLALMCETTVDDLATWLREQGLLADGGN